MADLRVSWFDNKYPTNLRPSLEDKAQLFQDFRFKFHFSERSRKEIEHALRECLFVLEQKAGYAPSVHTMAHNLLFHVYPLTSPDKAVLAEYIQRYRAALKKHEGHVAFHSNFD